MEGVGAFRAHLVGARQDFHHDLLAHRTVVLGLGEQFWRSVVHELNDRSRFETLAAWFATTTASSAALVVAFSVHLPSACEQSRRLLLQGQYSLSKMCFSGGYRPHPLPPAPQVQCCLQESTPSRRSPSFGKEILVERCPGG